MFVELIMVINVIAYEDPILDFDPLLVPHRAGVMGPNTWLSKTPADQLLFPEHLQQRGRRRARPAPSSGSLESSRQGRL